MSFKTPEKKYKGYIFDCDGTLADTMPLHLRAWNHGLKMANAPLQLDGKAFMTVAGMALQQTIDHWNKTHDIQIDSATVMLNKNLYYQKYQSEISAIEEVVDYVRACEADNASISVASGGERVDVHATLKLIGLEGVFPVIVTADDVERSKPAPDLFLLAAEKMGIHPQDCLVIEDSLLGVEAADVAGMDSVLVPHPF